jgi:hypothetical protein
MFGTCPFLEIWSEPLAILSNRNFQSPLFFQANTFTFKYLYPIQLNYFYNKENLKKSFGDKCHKLLKLEINMRNA